MPNARVEIGNGFGIAECGGFVVVRSLGILTVKHVFISQHQEEAFQILLVATQPILEAEHEVPGILCFFHGEEFQHSGQGPQQLQHGILETRARLLFALLHEAADDALGLTNLCEGEAAHFVQAHDLRHGWEHHRYIKVVFDGFDSSDDFVCQVF